MHRTVAGTNSTARAHPSFAVLCHALTSRGSPFGSREREWPHRRHLLTALRPSCSKGRGGAPPVAPTVGSRARAAAGQVEPRHVAAARLASQPDGSAPRAPPHVAWGRGGWWDAGQAPGRCVSEQVFSTVRTQRVGTTTRVHCAAGLALPPAWAVTWLPPCWPLETRT